MIIILLLIANINLVKQQWRLYKEDKHLIVVIPLTESPPEIFVAGYYSLQTVDQRL